MKSFDQFGFETKSNNADNNAPLADDLVAFGEVGLTGEIRSVNFIEKRISEAAKLGFKRCGIIYLENGDPRIAYQLVV